MIPVIQNIQIRYKAHTDCTFLHFVFHKQPYLLEMCETHFWSTRHKRRRYYNYHSRPGHVTRKLNIVQYLVIKRVSCSAIFTSFENLQRKHSPVNNTENIFLAIANTVHRQRLQHEQFTRYVRSEELNKPTRQYAKKLHKWNSQEIVVKKRSEATTHAAFVLQLNCVVFINGH